MKKLFLPLLIGFAVILITISVYSFFVLNKKLDKKIEMQAQIGGEFQLEDINGNEITEKDLLGKISLMYFGYTYCPDVCPTTLQVISTALEQLSEEERAQINTYFISVDPKRDTKELLRSYMENFHPTIVALTGSEEKIAKMAKEYKIFYQVRENEGKEYLIDHSTYFYLLDIYGNYITHFNLDSTADTIVSVIKDALVTKSINETINTNKLKEKLELFKSK